MTQFALGTVVGSDGNGIESIEKTSTSGLVDTYTITFDNGDTETFDVTNGEDGSTVSVTQVLSSGTKLATITIDGTSTDLYLPSASTSTSGIVQLVDNLTTDDNTKALSAKQGKALADLIGDAITYINGTGS